MNTNAIPLNYEALKSLVGKELILREYRRNRKTKSVSEHLHKVVLDEVSNIYGTKVKSISVTLLEDGAYTHKLFEFDPDKEEARGVGDALSARYIFTKL